VREREADWASLFSWGPEEGGEKRGHTKTRRREGGGEKRGEEGRGEEGAHEDAKARRGEGKRGRGDYGGTWKELRVDLSSNIAVAERLYLIFPSWLCVFV
jgi:hypothetical protein